MLRSSTLKGIDKHLTKWYNHGVGRLSAVCTVFQFMEHTKGSFMRIAYICTSKQDSSFQMLLRPMTDIYTVDNKIFMSYIDSTKDALLDRSIDESNVDATKFYTTHEVKKPEDIMKVLSHFDVYKLNTASMTKYEDAKPESLKAVEKVVTRRFYKCLDEMIELEDAALAKKNFQSNKLSDCDNEELFDDLDR